MQNGTWLALSQYAFIMAFSGITSLIVLLAFRMLRILKRKRNFDSSPSYRVYLFWLLLCSMALSLQYAILLFASFMSLPSSVSPTQIIFWSGLVPGSLLPSTPITILFLALDRLFIVLLPSLYMRQTIKTGLAACSSVAVIGLFTMSCWLNLAQRPTKEVPECISFGCLTSDASRLIYAVNRVVIAVPNFVAGTAFLVVLCMFRHRVQHQHISNADVNRPHRMCDRLAAWVVVFEFALDLLPNTVNMALTAYNVNISVYVGAFRSLTYCLCAFCSAIVHTAVLWHIFGTQKVVNLKTGIQQQTVAAPKTRQNRMTVGTNVKPTDARVIRDAWT